MLEELLKHLRAITSWSDETLQEHLKSWKQEQHRLLDSIAGERIWHDKGELIFESIPGHQELARLSLYQDYKPQRTAARGIGLLNSKDGRPQAQLAVPPECQPGLLVCPDKVLIYAPELESGSHLALAQSWIDTAPHDLRGQHVDLFVHQPSGLLLAACREAGEIVVISLDSRSELVRWQIRGPGSMMAMNIAFDSGGQEAYITDNVSAQLWIADLESLENKVWKSGLGILGNLSPAPEPGKVFLSMLSPNLSLVYFDLDKMQATYSIDLRGQSWVSSRSLAWDPMQISADGKLLHYMTWTQGESGPGPVLNVIDRSEVIALRRFSPKDPLMSVQLAYPHENPFKAAQALDFKTWLLKKGLVSAAQLEQTVASLNPVKSAPKPVRRDFRIYQPPPEDPDLWERIGKPSDQLELPLAAEEAIVDLLNWAFYRMTLTNLRIHPEELRRLQALARQLRSELASQEVVLAKLENVLGKHAFETPISRKAVMELIHQGKLTGEMVRLEDLCPICQTPFEAGLCPACGFRLSLPEEQAHAPGSVSAEPASALYPGQLLMPDRSQNALLTLNIWRQPLQRLDAQNAGIQQLSHAVALPNHNYLCADLKGNKVIEISPSGEVLWKAKLALKQPVQVSYLQVENSEHFLIVDQGNARVLEQDRSGRSWRRYPTLKTTDADKLKSPRDLQVTPQGSWLISDPGIQAVLEVDARGQVLRRWGAESGVSSPLLARRQPDGCTDILDAASASWLEFLADGSPGRQFKYWPPQDSPWSGAAAPDWACQLHNGEYLLLGEGYFMLLAPRSQSVRWIAAIPDAVKEDALLKVSFRSRSADETRKQQLEAVSAALKGMGLLEAESDEHLQYLARHVQQLSVKAGDWLVRPGDTGNAMYFVISGELEVIAHEDELPVIMNVSPGDLCGQQAVFAQDDKTYRPGLRAKEECKLLQLERSEFKKAVVGFPKLYNLIRTQDHELQRRFRLFAERKTEAVQDHLRSRIAETRIREFGLFAGATDAFFEALADKVQARAYLPEQEVFGRMESAGSLFLILEGQVGVLRKGEYEPMVVLAEGDIFGEMALYLDAPRSASIRTLDYCKFFEIEYRHIRALGKFFPWFTERLEDMAKQRAASNESARQGFEEAAGLDRQDLPQVRVEPGGMRAQKLFYFASLHHDALLGLNTLGEILWFWGREPERQLFQPHRMHELGHSFLVCDTGNDRVLEIDAQSREVLRKWSAGLSQPQAACLTPEGLLLVADKGNQRLVVMDESGREVWTHGLPEEIMHPTWVEFSPEGHILFADAGMHRVYELQRDGVLLWKYGKWRNPGSSLEQLDSPACVRRLDDGGTLIADTGNQRLVWIRPEADTLLIPLEAYRFSPDYCEMLENGEILVSSRADDLLIKINRRGELVWRASLSFPELAITEKVSKASFEERWILDPARLKELGPIESPDQPQSPPAAEVDALQDLGLVLGLESREPSGKTESFEPVASLLMPELDQALDELHQELEPQSPAEPSWADLAFLDSLPEDSNSTLYLVPENAPSPAEESHPWQELGFLDHESPAVSAAQQVLEAMPEDLDSAMDLLFEDEPESEPQSEALETSAPTEAEASPLPPLSFLKPNFEPATQAAEPPAEISAQKAIAALQQAFGSEAELQDADLRDPESQPKPASELADIDWLEEISKTVAEPVSALINDAPAREQLTEEATPESNPWDLGI